MNTWNPKVAIHRTAESIYELRREHEKIAIYDDEETDCLSLYLMDGEKLWPARTIFLGDISRALEIIGSWGSSRPLVDRRNNPTFKLP